MKNNVFKSNNLEEYFSKNRINWKDFYPSERKIISFVKPNKLNNVLDIGCGCGGLGLALREKFGIVNYTGVEINYKSFLTAKKMNKNGIFLLKDLLNINNKELKRNNFDFVFSLSCLDWNNNYLKMLNKSWDYVTDGGFLIVTLRLTDQKSINNFSKSYQYINYQGLKKGEKARYVILNVNEILKNLKNFNPSKIIAHGYWGKPSTSAVTKYSKLCFTAIAIQKRKKINLDKLIYKLNLPKDILSTINY